MVRTCEPPEHIRNLSKQLLANQTPCQALVAGRVKFQLFCTMCKFFHSEGLKDGKVLRKYRIP